MKRERVKVNLVENRLIVWDPMEGTQLYKSGYYGKPLGIPKPRLLEFNVPLLLDLFEGLYLLEGRRIAIYQNGKKIKKQTLTERAERIYHNFQLKYRVYKELRDRGLVVQPGIKFGCDFGVYERGPGIDHAPYLIQVKEENDTLDAVDIVRAGRLATTVRKRFIVAVPSAKTKNIRYLQFRWWKA